MSVANQKNLELHKQEKATKDELIAVRSQKAERLAAKNLSPSAFKVWLYVTANKNGYSFDLSSADVADAYGVSARSFTAAMKELETAGYIVPKTDKKRYYDFYDMPQPIVVKIDYHCGDVD